MAATEQHAGFEAQRAARARVAHDHRQQRRDGPGHAFALERQRRRAAGGASHLDRHAHAVRLGDDVGDQRLDRHGLAGVADGSSFSQSTGLAAERRHRAQGVLRLDDGALGVLGGRQALLAQQSQVAAGDAERTAQVVEKRLENAIQVGHGKLRACRRHEPVPDSEMPHSFIFVSSVL